MTLAVSVAFLTYAVVDWPGNNMEEANQIGEMASFWVVGLVSGYLFDRQKSLLQPLQNPKRRRSSLSFRALT